MDERLQFVRDAMRDHFTMSEWCARYGVSRRVGYKWLARYEAEGRGGLVLLCPSVAEVGGVVAAQQIVCSR